MAIDFKSILLAVVLLFNLYVIASCLMVLDIVEQVEISKLSSSNYVEYRGESFKNIESVKVAIAQKQFSKLFMAPFIEIPLFGLQLIIGFTMGLFGGGIKTFYEILHQKYESILLAPFFGGLMGVFIFFIMRAFPTLLSRNEVIVSNYVLACISLVFGFIPQRGFEVIRSKLEKFIGIEK